MAVYYTVIWPYPTVCYGTVYGCIHEEDTVWYGRNLKLRLRLIPTPKQLIKVPKPQNGLPLVKLVQYNNSLSHYYIKIFLFG